MFIKISRCFASMLCLLLLFGVFTGCRSKSNEGTTGLQTQKTSTGIAEKKGPEPITLPLVKEKITLTCFAIMNSKTSATLKSHSEVACYKEMEKRTGIHVEFIHPPTGQDMNQLNLLLASRDLPDFIQYNWFNMTGGPGKAVSDGSIIKLNDLIDKYGPNMSKILIQTPQIKKEAILDDGTFFQYPVIYESNKITLNLGPMIRKDWLDKLGLQLPKTIDELYTVLKAFKEKDPNGNGNPNDEIPFVSNKDTGLKYLAGAWGLMADFYNDKGKVKYGPIEPAYKDYLTTLSKWYKEGLIDSEYPLSDQANFRAKVVSNKGGFCYDNIAAGMGRHLETMLLKDPKFNLVGLTWPVGPAGKPFSTFAEYRKLLPGTGRAITKNNKYPVESIKYMDYAYGEEAQMLFNWGIEGESYKIVNGKPQFTDLILKNPQGLSVDIALARYSFVQGADLIIKSWDAYVQTTLTYPQQVLAADTWANNDMSLLLPQISTTADESTRLANIMSEVKSYTDEMFNKFVIGQIQLTEFDNYVNTIKKMKIEDVLKIQQDALDRYNKR